jgi:hypothetical protein
MTEDQALGRLREILARPEYQVEQGAPWWAQLLAPVVDLLEHLLARLVQLVVDAASGRGGPIGVVVLAACIVLAAIVGLYLARAVHLSVTREGR